MKKIRLSVILIIISFMTVFFIINFVKPNKKNNHLIYGDSKAPITIVEYTNFACVDCYNLHQNISEDLKNYIDNSIVRYELKHVSIDKLEIGSYIYNHVNNLESLNTLSSIYDNYKLWKNTKDYSSLNRYLNISNTAYIHRKELSFDDDEIVENNILVVPTMYINGKKYTYVLSKEEFKEIIETELSNN